MKLLHYNDSPTNLPMSTRYIHVIHEVESILLLQATCMRCITAAMHVETPRLSPTAAEENAAALSPTKWFWTHTTIF
jgi:hypothetical protein